MIAKYTQMVHKMTHTMPPRQFCSGWCTGSLCLSHMDLALRESVPMTRQWKTTRLQGGLHLSFVNGLKHFSLQPSSHGTLGKKATNLHKVLVRLGLESNRCINHYATCWST